MITIWMPRFFFQWILWMLFRGTGISAENNNWSWSSRSSSVSQEKTIITAWIEAGDTFSQPQQNLKSLTAKWLLDSCLPVPSSRLVLHNFLTVKIDKKWCTSAYKSPSSDHYRSPAGTFNLQIGLVIRQLSRKPFARSHQHRPTKTTASTSFTPLAGHLKAKHCSSSTKPTTIQTWQTFLPTFQFWQNTQRMEDYKTTNVVDDPKIYWPISRLSTCYKLMARLLWENISWSWSKWSPKSKQVSVPVVTVVIRFWPWHAI